MAFDYTAPPSDDISITMKQHGITVTIETNLISLDDVIHEMVVPALVGLGYSYEGIREYIEER